MHGRVAADGPVADAAITVIGPDGQPIAPLAGERTTTNANGMYSLRFAALPADFKVVAKGGTVGGKTFDAAAHVAEAERLGSYAAFADQHVAQI